MSLAVLVIGSGQRVRRAALPALLRRPKACHITGIFSRKPKQIFAEDKHGHPESTAFEVTALADLAPATLAGADLIYLCVSKGAVPKVLQQLASLAASMPDQAPALLIDTPVLYFKHMAAAKHFAAFKRVWVAEDMSTLPWLDALAAAREALPELGRPRRLTLDRSAFAYHGVALAKTLLGDMQLVRARRRALGSKTEKGEARHERELHFQGGATALIHEPRDYSVGGFHLELEGGAISDPGSAEPGPGALRLACRFEAGRCVGFTVKRGQEAVASTELEPHEIELLGHFDADGTGAQPGVIAHMDAMKRVGFARLLDRLAAGEPIWDLDDGLDDMWIDYLTEKTGRWRRSPLTSAHSKTARGLVGLAMSMAMKVKR